jgi:hypothetical protein
MYLRTTLQLHSMLHDKRVRDDVSRSMCLSGTKTRSRQNIYERKKWIDEHSTRVGIPLVAMKNLNTKKVVNGRQYTLASIDGDGDVVLKHSGGHELISLSRKEFNSHCRYGFCDSVFRNQGRTLEERYNLFDVELMHFRDIYTALSRFRTLDNIHFNCTEYLQTHTFSMKDPPDKQMEVRLSPPKLLDASIYRIIDGMDNQYIGYTTGTLAKRYAEHLEMPTSEATSKWLKEANTEIELVRKLSCRSISEVLVLEAQFIERVPFTKSKNIRHKQKLGIDWDTRCKFIVKRASAKKGPKVADDVKHKRFKVQKRGHKTGYFSYIDANKDDARADATAYSESLVK